MNTADTPADVEAMQARLVVLERRAVHNLELGVHDGWTESLVRALRYRIETGDDF